MTLTSNRLTGMWLGYFSGDDRQYIGLSNYSVSGPRFQHGMGVASILQCSRTLTSSRLKRVRKNSYRILANPPQIHGSDELGMAADMWGELPFAPGRAIYRPIATPKPSTDSHFGVYNVQVLLRLGPGQFANCCYFEDRTPASRYLFGGDPDAWTKVANTLKARFYLHVRDYAKAAFYSDAALVIDDAIRQHDGHAWRTYLQNLQPVLFVHHLRQARLSGS